MGVRHMQGTPAYIEKVHREEDDPRRHKSRCSFFERNTETCGKRNMKCIGSAHCSDYCALSEEEFRDKRKRKTGEDDCYWY